MTTDPITREDLEMAAKAAGNPRGRRVAGGGLLMSNDLYWNPGKDDGDCARMCGAIDASTVFSPDTQSVSVTSPTAEQWIDVSYLDHSGDKMAAWRYASVKLAAAVGRAMT